MKHFKLVILFCLCISTLSINQNSAHIDTSATNISLSQEEFTTNVMLLTNNQVTVSIDDNPLSSLQVISSIEFPNSRLHSVYDNPLLILENKEALDFSVVTSSLTSLFGSSDEMSTGNMIQIFRVYERTMSKWDTFCCWLMGDGRLINERYTSLSDGQNSVLINFNLQNANVSSDVSFGQVEKSYQNFLKTEDNSVQSAYFSPYKIFNEFNKNKHLETTFDFSFHSLNDRKEYVMEIENIVYGASKNGNPNKNIIYNEISQVYLRFDNFDESISGTGEKPINEYSNPPPSYYLTYISVPLGLIIIITLIYLSINYKKIRKRLQKEYTGENHPENVNGSKKSETSGFLKLISILLSVGYVIFVYRIV